MTFTAREIPVFKVWCVALRDGEPVTTDSEETGVVRSANDASTAAFQHARLSYGILDQHNWPLTMRVRDEAGDLWDVVVEREVQYDYRATSQRKVP